jgi:adenosylcobinamide kinase/adenosylcobinamide-phosphate guanylyltransferase
VATCPLVDAEMRERIVLHQQARARSQWHTIEETLDLAGVLAGDSRHEVLLVDCLTLWVNNLMFAAESSGRELSEENMEAAAGELQTACRGRPGTVIFVTNEVGMGLVPASPQGRRFRDLAGRCNQVIAAEADTVTLMVCGIPLNLKG